MPEAGAPLGGGGPGDRWTWRGRWEAVAPVGCCPRGLQPTGYESGDVPCVVHDGRSRAPWPASLTLATMLFSWIRRGLGLALVIFLAFVAGRLFLLHPSIDREWKVEHAAMPQIEFDGSAVHVANVRSFRYRSADQFDVGYVDRVYDLERLDSVWFVLSPFREDWRGPAHSFLSFGFGDSLFVSVSVEARKEVGESYSIWKGLLNQYELLYVVGEETDLVALRAVYWNDDVFVYPIATSQERMRVLFADMMERARELGVRPEFYNTAWNNCTTNLYDHVEKIAPEAWSWDWRLLLPGYSDQLPYERGLLDTELTLAQARERFRVNERARVYADDPRFSALIRTAR